MSGFDISDYPDNTDKVLAAIYLDGPHDENDGMSRREIAYETDLSYDKARTRADKLAEGGHLSMYWNDNNAAKRPVALYTLTNSVRDFAAGAAESVRLFGDIPEEFNREHIMTIHSEFSLLRDKKEIEHLFPDDLRELNAGENGRLRSKITERLSQIEDEVCRMDEEMEILHNKAEMMVEDFEDPPVVDPSPEKAKCIRCDESKPVYLIKENNRAMCKDCYITAEGRPASCENCGMKSEQYLMLDSGIVCVHCLANHML